MQHRERADGAEQQREEHACSRRARTCRRTARACRARTCQHGRTPTAASVSSDTSGAAVAVRRAAARTPAAAAARTPSRERDHRRRAPTSPAARNERLRHDVHRAPPPRRARRARRAAGADIAAALRARATAVSCERAVERRLHAVEERLRHDAHPEDQHQQRHEHQPLAQREVRQRAGSPRASRARTSRAGTSTACRHADRITPVRREHGPRTTACGTRRAAPGTRRRSRSCRAGRCDESITTRKIDRVDRHHLPQPAEVRDQARVAALVDHADEEEQRAGRDAVVQHRQHRARDALRVQRHTGRACRSPGG